MFSFVDRVLDPRSQKMSRREMLRVGSLGLGGLSLSGMLAAKAHGAGSASLVKDKAVVLIFLQGGPTQIETFDPKMSAPAEIRSMTGEIQPKIPGVTFGSDFPKLAARANKFSVVRSFASNNGDHQNYLTVSGGDNKLKVPMGSLYARVAGANHPVTGMPSNCVVLPEAVSTTYKPKQNFETQSLKKLLDNAKGLGAAYAPFDPSGGGELRQNLEMHLPRARFDSRRQLLVSLDTFRRQVDSTRLFDNANAYEQQAYELIIKGVVDAFDINKEDQRVIDRYDTSRMYDQLEVQKWYDMARSSNLLGKQLLMARRLVEAGCGFVQVMDAGWDMHANNNSPRNLGGLRWLGGQVDHALSAFLDDLENRGLSEKVLVILTGEMGRTPRINGNGGRDHWGSLTPLLVAGGGLKMGQVIGQSDRQAGAPATEKYTPKNLLGTVMHTVFNTGELRITRDVPKNIADSTTDSLPIPELV